MPTKTASIFVPGIMCMGIGFLFFNIFGAAFGLVLGFAMGEGYHQQYDDDHVDEI